MLLVIELVKTALITLVVCQAILLLLPPIVIKTKDQKYLQGSTARNNPLLIWIDPDQEHYLPVLAQETYECETRKWLHNLIAWYISDDYKRIIEAIGQEVEVQKVVELNSHINEKQYRLKQAGSLIKYYPQFKDWTAFEVETLMLRNRDKAQKWLRSSEEF